MEDVFAYTGSCRTTVKDGFAHVDGGKEERERNERRIDDELVGGIDTEGLSSPTSGSIPEPLSTISLYSHPYYHSTPQTLVTSRVPSNLPVEELVDTR